MVSEVVPIPRPFPWDVLLLILQHSDPSTLAALAGVYFDVLVVSSSHLYKDITLKDLGQLGQLFCERAETPPSSRINPYLSLSQTRNIYLEFTSMRSLPTSCDPSFDRIAHLPPLKLDLLQISFKAEHSMVLERLHRHILPALNPVRLEYVSVKEVRHEYDEPWFYFNCVPIPLLEGWSRIETIDLTGIIPYTWSDETQWGGEHFLACLSAPSLDRRRVVRLHLDSMAVLTGEERFSQVDKIDTIEILDWMMLYENSGSIQADLMQAGSILLVVESEELRREAQEKVEEWTSVNFGKEVRHTLVVEAAP